MNVNEPVDGVVGDDQHPRPPPRLAVRPTRTSPSPRSETGAFLSGWPRAGGGGRELTACIVGPRGVTRRHTLRVIRPKPALPRPRITELPNVAPLHLLGPCQAGPSGCAYRRRSGRDRPMVVGDRRPVHLGSWEQLLPRRRSRGSLRSPPSFSGLRVSFCCSRASSPASSVCAGRAATRSRWMTSTPRLKNARSAKDSRR